MYTCTVNWFCIHLYFKLILFAHTLQVREMHRGGDRHYKWEECTGDRHYTYNHFSYSYSQETINSVESLWWDFSINIAFNPINLGAKWKLLISRFQNSSWMLNLELNWPRYDRETKPIFSLKFMFLSYSYRFTSIDSFETFYDSS